jgi:hypothetical protein
MALLMFEWSTPMMNAFFMADQIETRMEESAEALRKLNAENGKENEDVQGAPAWYKRTTFILSGIFALNFFVVRILWGHYHYYHFYRVCWKLWSETPAWFNLSLMALILVAFLLNGTWMVQIVLTGLNLLPKPDSNTMPTSKDDEAHHFTKLVPDETFELRNDTFDETRNNGEAHASHHSNGSKTNNITKSPNGTTRSPKARRAKVD